MRQISVRSEAWPIAGQFVIARGAKTEAKVIVVQISEGSFKGWGEAVPYGRYGETIDGVLAQIDQARSAIVGGMDCEGLLDLMPPGAARNAIDCALWDLQAKQSGMRAYQRAGFARLDPVKTAYTISLGAPETMAEAAKAAAKRPMLKLKIGGPDDLDRVEAVRQAAPKTRLVVDANEALSFEDLVRLAPDFARLKVQLIEQPLPADQDEALEGYICPVMLCADESLHSRKELATCATRYGAINIKLDKAGGLTEALALRREAMALGLEIMAGCMVATSLSMAPALLIAQGAAIVDLDGPLLLAKDREPGLTYIGSMIQPGSEALWG
jgi:L-alanine-DL-glutamate epimerase-like enolase superfamily enzyme